MCMWSATWPKEVKRLAEDFLGRFIPPFILNKVCLHHGWFSSFTYFHYFTFQYLKPRTDFCHINIGSGELSANHDILQVAVVVKHLLGLKVQDCFFPTVLFWIIT